jgi:hypothetical protein
MELSLQSAIHKRLAKFLAGDATIDDLKSWLVSSTWSVSRADESGILFAREIKLLFAEHSGGFRSDEELRDELVTLLNRMAVEAALRDKACSIVTASGSTVIMTRAWSTLGSPFGEPRVMASAS